MIIKNTEGFPDWHFENTEEVIAWAEIDGKKYEIGPAEKDSDKQRPEFVIYVDEEQVYGTGTYSLGEAIRWCESVGVGFDLENNVFMDELRSIKSSVRLLENIIVNAMEKQKNK